jgi:hypothetical protein
MARAGSQSLNSICFSTHLKPGTTSRRARRQHMQNLAHIESHDAGMRTQPHTHREIHTHTQTKLNTHTHTLSHTHTLTHALCLTRLRPHYRHSDIQVTSKCREVVAHGRGTLRRQGRTGTGMLERVCCACRVWFQCFLCPMVRIVTRGFLAIGPAVGRMMPPPSCSAV